MKSHLLGAAVALDDRRAADRERGGTGGGRLLAGSVQQQSAGGRAARGAGGRLEAEGDVAAGRDVGVVGGRLRMT